MQIYKAPLNDIRFNLEALGYDRISSLPQFKDYDLDLIMSMAEEAGHFCTQEMLPRNTIGDQEGVRT